MGAIDPVIKANVSFSESGFVSLQDAVAFGEVEVNSFVGTSSLLCAKFQSFVDMGILGEPRKIEGLLWRRRCCII